MKLKTLDQLNPENKKILLRIDINSPCINNKIIDNPRFDASSITIKELLKKKAKLVILAHQGRPNRSDFINLKQHAKILSKKTKKRIKYIPDLFGENAEKSIKNLKQGGAILLENVRFSPEEKKEKSCTYKKFCKQFDAYINDAFSVSHRKQASIIIPPKYLPSYIGRQFEKEILSLEKISKYKKTTLLLGGAKIEDYLNIFKLLKNKKNKILASGVLANILLYLSGVNLDYEIEWLKKNNYSPLFPKLKKLYKKYKKQIILPEDFGLLKDKKRKPALLKDAPFKYKIYDVGPLTIKKFKKELKDTEVIFMKGPLGFSEYKEFSYGTVTILKYISNLLKNKKIYCIIGGGHLTTTLKKYKIKNKFFHISLSGGALLKYLGNEKLPGIEALK